MTTSEKVKEAWKYGYYSVLDISNLEHESKEYPYNLAFCDDEWIAMTNGGCSTTEFNFDDTRAMYENSISAEVCDKSCAVVKFIHYSEFFKDKEVKSQEEINKLL